MQSYNDFIIQARANLAQSQAEHPLQLLQPLKTNMERKCLVFLLDPDATERYEGNAFNGQVVLDFVFNGTEYVYKPNSGPDNCGEWVCRKR